MHKKSAGLLSLAVATGLGITLGPAALSAPAAPAAAKAANSAEPESRGHELPNPLEEKRRALKQTALQALLDGTGKVEKRGASTVMKVADTAAPAAANAKGVKVQRARHEPQYVELSRETTDKIFVVLTEFGNQRDPRFPDKDLEPSIPGPTTFDGPLHNAIPKPDRRVDNTTNWQKDSSQPFFQNLYFGTGGVPGSNRATESVRQYYERQSSGRYSIDGTVTNWVKVPYNEARYGRSSDNPNTNGDDPNVCSGSVCSTTWALVRDGLNTWYADQLASGRSKADVTAELKSFDEWDRYDVDNDGKFNEPDGYLDHFQIVHAGGDEADGDPIQGEDAIWSHRWYAYISDAGVTGPAGAKLGGTQIGDTGVWAGDYTVQPENGGMSVFAHEYGHDLGLPDLYDTSGPGAVGENSVNWWSMMAQSRVSGQSEDGLGSRGADLGAYEKFQLGWLDYEVANAGENHTFKLGPHEYNTARPQAAIVVLPKKQVTTDLVQPYEGSKSWWSGTGDDLTATMTHTVTLPAGAAALDLQANYNTEADFDYWYVEVNTGSGWMSIPGTGTDPAVNNGIDGDTGGAWVPAHFDLSAYAGSTFDLRVRYTTDGAVQGNDPAYPAGVFVDAIKVSSGATVLFEDGAEAGSNGWALDGFAAFGSTTTNEYSNYYIASNRAYVSFDRYLKSGPYNFGFASKPDFVEHFPYQNGVLINYWDTSQSDNNASEHPGEGLILPIDAHPKPITRVDGNLWRPRVAGYDATFGKEKADTFWLHVNDKRSLVKGEKAQPKFSDALSYWSAAQPTASVKVPNHGVDLTVTWQAGLKADLKLSARS